MHFKRADSEASPATARCEHRHGLLITLKMLHCNTGQVTWNLFPSRHKEERVEKKGGFPRPRPIHSPSDANSHLLPCQPCPLPTPNCLLVVGHLKVSPTLGKNENTPFQPTSAYFSFPCRKASKPMLFPCTHFWLQIGKHLVRKETFTALFPALRIKRKRLRFSGPGTNCVKGKGEDVIV